MAALKKLKTMRDMEIQQWLRKIDAEDLKIAMTSMDHDEQACVLRNMSPRAGDVIKTYLQEKKMLPAIALNTSCRNLERALDML